MKLNPHSLEVNVRDLSRGLNILESTIPIGDIEWCIEEVRPEGDNGILSLSLDYRDDSITCSGTLDAVFSIQCARCLEPVLFKVTEDIRSIYMFSTDYDEESGSEEVSPEGFLNLFNAVREAVMLSIPGKPLCSSDCPGICYI